MVATTRLRRPLTSARKKSLKGADCSPARPPRADVTQRIGAALVMIVAAVEELVELVIGRRLIHTRVRPTNLRLLWFWRRQPPKALVGRIFEEPRELHLAAWTHSSALMFTQHKHIWDFQIQKSIPPLLRNNATTCRRSHFSQNSTRAAGAM